MANTSANKQEQTDQIEEPVTVHDIISMVKDIQKETDIKLEELARICLGKQYRTK